jgi:hypothetical protein
MRCVMQEVYDVSVKSASFFERKVPARKAVSAARRLSQDDPLEGGLGLEEDASRGGSSSDRRQRDRRRGSTGTSEADAVRQTLSDSLKSILQSHASFSTSSEFVLRSDEQFVQDKELLSSWVGPRGPMRIRRFVPQFACAKREHAFMNSKTQSTLKMEDLHAGFIFQLAISLWMSHQAITGGRHNATPTQTPHRPQIPGPCKRP